MDKENEINHNLNIFSLNQGEQNFEQGLNNLIPNNILDRQNGQLIQNDNNNQVLPSFQPMNYINSLNNQIGNLLEDEKEENQNNEEYNVQGKDSDNKKSFKGSKKHSKSENEGRTFECKICNKSYLSYPALYTHCKKKNHINNSSGRGRGRPKKEGLEMETEKTKYNPINHTYFFKEERNGKTEISEIEKCIKTAFNELYFKNITIEMNLDI